MKFPILSNFWMTEGSIYESSRNVIF